MVWSLGVEQAGLGEEVSEQSWCYLCYLHLLPLCSLRGWLCGHSWSSFSAAPTHSLLLVHECN